jgi:hypothetical protein
MNRGDIEYFKIWYRFSGWEYYKKSFAGCYFWNTQRNDWSGCGEPTKMAKVEVSPLEMLVMFGSEAVRGYERND